MPTYEYACNSCKAVYDLRQGFDAEITHTCEECGKGIAKRVLHAPPVVFKGGGWYATDSRSKSGSESGKSDSAGAASEPSKPAASEGSSPSEGIKAAAAKSSEPSATP